jgi:quercetin dioxygenase-like cupin family protein
VSYQVVSLSEIPPQDQDFLPTADWKPLRRYFGIRSFGTNVTVAREPGPVVMEHTETGDSGTRHEELYLVVSGHATFTVGTDEIDAPAGTLVYVPDPDERRGARALETGTVVLAVGGEPGTAFEVSAWEEEYSR